MINRNKFSKVKKDDNGKRYYEDTDFPYIRSENNDIYIYSSEGDSLDVIAQEYYGDAGYWFIIADVNNLDGMNLEGGIQLKIPDIKLYIDSLEKENK